VEIPEQAMKMFGCDELRFGREMLESAVVRWFEEGFLSAGQGSEMLRIAVGEFFDLLNRHKVSLIQMTPEELASECRVT